MCIRSLTNDVLFLFQSRHSDSLALLYVLHDDYDRASYYAGNYQQNFLAVSNFDQALVYSMHFYLFSLLINNNRQKNWILIGRNKGYYCFAIVLQQWNGENWRWIYLGTKWEIKEKTLNTNAKRTMVKKCSGESKCVINNYHNGSDVSARTRQAATQNQKSFWDGDYFA